eukprot:395917-Amphidinium_carterae.1
MRVTRFPPCGGACAAVWRSPRGTKLAIKAAIVSTAEKKTGVGAGATPSSSRYAYAGSSGSSVLRDYQPNPREAPCRATFKSQLQFAPAGRVAHSMLTSPYCLYDGNRS